MKLKTIVLALILTTALLVGCGDKEVSETPDAVTTASVVADEASLLKAVSEDGSWIVIFTQDFTTDKELILEGEFVNKDKPARKLALYSQDEDRNKTAAYTLTAPKLTVKSKNARIQGGTFVGDVYVEAKGFSIIDAKVEGNVYFANEEIKSTFMTDKGGTVAGVTEVINK